MNILKFPLAWRWTESSHALLSPDVLVQLRPLSPAEALQVHTAAAAATKSGCSCPTNDPHPEATRMWLRRVQPDLAVSVYVSWSQDLAIETTWSIFTEYWDAFCYPSSDDVTVVPVTGSWRLVYHHYEQFEFYESR